MTFGPQVETFAEGGIPQQETRRGPLCGISSLSARGRYLRRDRKAGMRRSISRVPSVGLTGPASGDENGILGPLSPQT